MEIIDVVDKDDRVIDQQPRTKCHEESLLHRGASVIVYRSSKKNEILLQKRSEDKTNSPGKLCFTGGHIAAGNSYREGAEKEFFEELYSDNERDVDLKEITKFRKSADDDHEFMKVFETVDQGPFEPGDEVAKVMFVEIDEVKEILENSPERFTETTVRIFDEVFKERD